jgi:glycosyltransferase involved in cell wall biosynthesis
MSASVSALMITRPNRTQLASQAVTDFVNQTYTAGPRELVVVSDEPIAEQLEWAQQVTACGATFHYVHAAPGATLGALRNLSLDKASGTWLIQWDDDDRYGPQRITTQIEHSIHGHVASCLDSQLYYFTETRELCWIDWRKRLPRSILIPGTVCVRSDVARTCRYPEMRQGEDGVFLQRVCGCGPVAQITGLAGLDYLRRFHGANTWTRAHFKNNVANLGKSRHELRQYEPVIRQHIQAAHYLPEPGRIQVTGSDGLAFEIEVPGA